MKDDLVYLHHIAASLARVERYLDDGQGSLDEDRWYCDEMIQDAVMRRLETLADAASHLSKPLRDRHPDIAWREVTDFRNVLAHGYIDVRLDRVWQAITIDLPARKTVVAKELGSKSGA